MKSGGSQEGSDRAFSAVRIITHHDVPPADERVLDVALLDMHHNFPNLGHDSLVRAVGEIAREVSTLLAIAGMSVRVISYDVRRSHMIPEAPGKRHLLYLGSGGPGHIDPHLNDGTVTFSQGIREDPAWEIPLFRLFDEIARNQEAALIAVCHTFGVLCRWSGIAQPVLRSANKGGKSSGIVENVLVADVAGHPWFRLFSRSLPDGRHFLVLDNRLFDLLPSSRTFPHGMTCIAFESASPGGNEGDAMTMMEFARDTQGVMPRILAVNHHPEIRDRRRQLQLLSDKLARGEVTEEWYNERARVLTDIIYSRAVEEGVMVTSRYSLIAPLRFHLYRLIRKRAADLGCRIDLHENQVLGHLSGTLNREEDGHF